MESTNQISLDNTQQQAFIKFFNSLPEKPPTTIRFFDRNGYYTVHGPDAVFSAKEVFRTTSFIKNIGSDSETLETQILNKSQFETFVRDLLLVKLYRVEVYTNKGNTSQDSWILEYKGSPGNLSQFEEILFTRVDKLEGHAVLSVKYNAQDKIVGVALVDTVDNSFSVAEFIDDQCLSILESIFVQFSPKECIVTDGNSLETENVKKIGERCNILVTARKKSDFASDGLVQDLNRLLKFSEGQHQNANSLPQINWSIAMSSLASVIKYLELCGDSDNFGQFEMRTLDNKNFVHLDLAAVYALGISSTESDPRSRRNLLSLLDKCQTSQGRRLLHSWIKQPLKDKNLICERHDIVESLVNRTILRQSLYEDHLRRIPDLQVISKKLVRKKAIMQDCYRIYQAVEKIPLLIASLEEGEDEPHPTLRHVVIDPLKEHLKDMEKFQEMVVSILDMSLVDKGEFLIIPEYDDDLKELRDEMDTLEDKMNEEMNRVALDLDLEANKTLKLEANAQYGYHFRAAIKEEEALRDSEDYVQLDASKNVVRFRNVKLGDINDEYLEIRDRYTIHQHSVVSEVISIAAGYMTPLLSISNIIAQLDVLCSFAVVSCAAPKPYVRPVMKAKGSGAMHLSQVRHPVLEMMDNVSFIPNDLDFNTNNALFYIITGPNMGGKSTYIRSVGIAALLAHIGCFVPADSAEIPILDAILTRIGANDSQLKGMSTFMVEMIESASILKHSTADSLVIIDELGRGTSTYDGCGIAWAIAEYLATEVKSFTLFATHYHEITRLSDDIPHVQNVHVSAVTAEDSLVLLYQLKPGACDRCFGIHLAKMAGFPQHIIQDAERILAELEDYQSSMEVDSDVKKRKILREGEAMITDALQRCQSLKNLNDDDLREKINQIKTELERADNPYINTLLKQNSGPI